MPFVHEANGPASHPAFLNFQRSGYAGCAPDRIERIETLLGSSDVYLLEGLEVPGSRVVAKRSAGERIRVEHFVYTSLLPHHPLSQVACLGFVEELDQDSCWLFLEFADGNSYDETSQKQRELAAKWLATLHSSTSQLPQRPPVPDAGPDRYLALLRKAGDSIGSNLSNPHLTVPAARFLEIVLDRLDRFEKTWTRVQSLCSAIPNCVVHGDFHAKNVRIRDGQVLVFDWEAAGWGPPTEELAGLGCHEYSSALGGAWPAMDPATIRLATSMGVLFRGVAFIQAESAALGSRWTVDAVEAIAGHERDLVVAERELGLS